MKVHFIEIQVKLNRLQDYLHNVINHIKEYDTLEPYFLRFLHTMDRNISICREYHFTDIEELVKILNEDWKNANNVHTGFPEYHIFLEDFEERVKVNNQLLNIVKMTNNLLCQITDDVEEMKKEQNVILAEQLCICSSMDKEIDIATAKHEDTLIKFVNDRFSKGVFSKIPMDEVGEYFEKYNRWQSCDYYICNHCGTKWLFVHADFPAHGRFIRLG